MNKYPPGMDKSTAIAKTIKMAAITKQRLRLVSTSYNDAECKEWWYVEMDVKCIRGQLLNDSRVVRAIVWPDGGIDYV